MSNCIFCKIAAGEAQQDVFHLHFHIVPRQRGDHQNVVWTTHPEWTEKYDQLLESLK